MTDCTHTSAQVLGLHQNSHLTPLCLTSAWSRIFKKKEKEEKEEEVKEKEEEEVEEKEEEEQEVRFSVAYFDIADIFRLTAYTECRGMFRTVHRFFLIFGLKVMATWLLAAFRSVRASTVRHTTTSCSWHPRRHHHQQLMRWWAHRSITWWSPACTVPCRHRRRHTGVPGNADHRRLPTHEHSVSSTGNETLPKLIINDTLNYFIKLQSAFR